MPKNSTSQIGAHGRRRLAAQLARAAWSTAGAAALSTASTSAAAGPAAPTQVTIEFGAAGKAGPRNDAAATTSAGARVRSGGDDAGPRIARSQLGLIALFVVLAGLSIGIFGLQTIRCRRTGIEGASGMLNVVAAALLLGAAAMFVIV